MAIEWSKEQKRIINSVDGNLLASASAGSGKTTVMLERVRHLIVDKHVPVRRIVMLSFNKAIAKEIKTRLIEMLESEVFVHPDLATEIDNIETAPITTIDGFCNSLVTEYFERLDIGADCSILEGTAQQTLLRGVIVNTIKSLKASSDERIYGMIDKFGGEKKLIEAIGEVYGFSCVVPDREDWLARAYGDAEQIRFDNICSRYLDMLNKRHKSELHKAEELLYDLDSQSAAYKILLININAMTDILNSQNYQDLFQTKLNYEPLLAGARLVFKKDTSIDIEYAKATINTIRTNVKKIFEMVNEDYQTEYAKYKCSIKDSSELARYALLTHSSFTELKKSLGVLDFADLTFYAAKLLQDDVLSEEIAAKYDYIFIDEYQDTNFIGEYILSRISRNNLFMVGDAKQSIYGFRLAEPQIMINKIKTLTEDDILAKRSRNELSCVNLNDNYRSDVKILEFVNGIFDVIMTKNYGGIEYKDTDRFVGKAVYNRVSDTPSSEVAWVFVPKSDETKQKSGSNEMRLSIDEDVYNPYEDVIGDKDDASARAEGKYIASAIKKFIRQKIYDSKTESVRKAEPQDICILSRYCIKKGNKIDKIIKTLEAEGISVSTDGLVKREEADEVAIILEMLKVIDNDTQDIPLAAVLKSVWCGMTSAEIADIRRVNKSIPFYELVRLMRDKNQKISYLYSIIDELRLRLAYYGVYDIVCALVYEFGYDKKLLHDNGNLGCVHDYIEGLRGYGGTLNEFLNSADLRFDTDGSNDNSPKHCVKAMTIHAAKGLEFPIVILIGAEEKFKKISSGIVVDKEFGIAVSMYDESKMIKSDNFVLNTLRNFKFDKETNEEMRLLYVALTRAKNHLLITGTVTENSLAIDDYTAPYNVASFRDWICNAVNAGSIPLKAIKVVEQTVNENTAITNVITSFDITPAGSEIENIINYVYPYKTSTKMGLKHTVTELITPDSYEDVPIFSGFYDDETDKVVRGTNYHVILENIDYGACTAEAVKSELIRMVSEQIIDSEQFASINIAEIVRVMNSEFISAARKEDAKYMREKQFMLRAKASDFYDCDCDDEILIQGAIDLIIDAEQLTVVDFKKSRKDRIGLIATYSRQLEIYARAVEQAMGRKVDRKIIYEIGRGETIEL